MHEQEIKVARFHFELRDGTPLILAYLLHNTSLRDRWIEQVNTRNAEPDTYLDLKIANKTIDDLPFLMEKINSIITGINAYYDKQLPLFTTEDEFNHDILNHLHEEFEIYGERHHRIIETEKQHLRNPQDPNVWPGTRFKKDFHELWMSLNEYIHIIESALSTTTEEGQSPNFSCLVQVYPPVLGELVQEQDKLFLETDFSWGQLYLGYNTLGKDYMHAAHDNDVRVIANDQIRVQQHFNTESWLNFSEGFTVPGESKIMFYEWYASQEPDVRDKIPIVNLNELALGRYHIGSLIIDDTFLRINSNEQEWQYNLELKKQWNLEVFSQIERAVKFEIVSIPKDVYKAEAEKLYARYH